MEAPTQVFPRRENGRIEHTRWVVDVDSALAATPRAGMTRERLRQEVAEMARHFPRWLLTLQLRRDVGLCDACRGMLVFDRGLRCVACGKKAGRPPHQAQLAWFGLMPPIGIDALTRVKTGVLAAPPRQHVVGTQEGIGHYLLVPLLAGYPETFPAGPVQVAYLPGFFRIPGAPAETASHSSHLFAGGQMCLFAPGQWRPEITCREVLQQRAYAHVIKMLNLANGKRDAFAIVS